MQKNTEKIVSSFSIPVPATVTKPETRFVSGFLLRTWSVT